MCETGPGKNSCAEGCEGWVANQREKKAKARHIRGHAQNEEQLSDALSGYSTELQLRKCYQHRLKSSQGIRMQTSRRWPNAKMIWDNVLGSFEQVHNTYRSDRPWMWVATMRTDAPVAFTAQSKALTTMHTEGTITIAAERMGKQSKSEELLWKWLKSRSKTTSAGHRRPA